MSKTFTLPAKINKSNVMQYLDEINSFAKSTSEQVLIDCSEVMDIDSAGIALLLDLSNNKSQQCSLVNFSNSIINLCNLYQIKFTST